MKTFDQHLLRGLGQNYLWEKYPGEIAPLGAKIVDGMVAFMPAHTAAVGLTGCSTCGTPIQTGVGDLTPITKIAAPYQGPVAKTPVTTPPTFTPPATIPNLPGAPGGGGNGTSVTAPAPVLAPAQTAPSSTNTTLMIAGVAAVAVGLGGILWLAHSQGS